MIIFELLESIDEYNYKQKAIISGDKFKVENNRLFIYHNDKLISIVVFKDFGNGSDDELEKYHVYI